MRKTSFWLSVALILASCAQKEEIEEPQTDILPAAREIQHLQVEFDEETAGRIESGDNLPGLAVVSLERVFDDGGEWEERHRAAGLHRWYRVGYDAAMTTPTKVASSVADFPGVVSASPELRIKPASYFNDPYAPKQWALYNDGTLGSNYVAGADINVVPVWENYTAGSSKVIVSVVDSGVDLSHPDLAAICLPGGVEGSKCFLNDLPGYKIYPDDHGTHVAGTIAAVNNNGIGVCGVAGGYDGNGGVRIMSCQIMHTDPNDPKITMQGNSPNAMVWGADHGAVISSNSWGYDYENESQASDGNVGSMGPAIDYFVKYAGCDNTGKQLPDSPMKGGVVIFAAGNDAWRHAWPAEYEGVIAVGAISSQMSRSYYSNYGDWVDIAAPGGDQKAGSTILSTISGDGYGGFQGTSMACPHVSGVAALLVSYFGGPGFTNTMLKERLLGGANTKLPSGYKIGPLVDAMGSFTYGGTVAPDPVSDFSVSTRSNNIDYSWAVTADADDGKAFGFLLLAAEDASLFSGLDLRNIPEGVSSTMVESSGVGVGEAITGTLKGLKFNTTYHTAIAAYDYHRNYSAITPLKTATTKANNPPVITTDYAGDYKVHCHEALNVEYGVSDPDGHTFTVAVETGSDALTWTDSESLVRLRFVGRDAPAGAYTATITVTDAFGGVATKVIDYEILPNHAPVVNKPFENLILPTIGQKVTVDLSEHIFDEDNETLKYTVTQSALSIVHVNPVANTVVITALSYGMSEVTIKATDTLGESCSITFKVLVRDPSRNIVLYPNPVKDVLNVSLGEAKTVDVSISNKAGATIYSASGISIDPFNPYSVKVKDFPGGVYYVRLKGEGIDNVSTIVKQ